MVDNYDSRFAQLVYFPEEFILLNEEITNHPELQLLLGQVPADDWQVKLGHVAAYVDIALGVEGELYTFEDLLGIAKNCTARLKGKRAIFTEPTLESKLILPN